MSATDFSITKHSCKSPNIADMDHKAGSDTRELRPMVNRMCLTCGTHWYGDARHAVFEMPALIWDRWNDTAWGWTA
ncbi:hypothetical protein [Pseudoxanthomonas winnipegensis]|uniref:Uncharacterized protein n=1 Tax=Pseudoxanthomonas winnipegensis TaxID=2480810 RepID=A0A4V2HCJ3_9GAMM|nr:hypothetical protein [Pseudoxanthomonas winnipegensis]TAA20329.1 hypothetical protein EA660_18240 [Pseudoxanthomonas winnipegensis]